MAIIVPPTTVAGQLEYYWLDPRGTLRNLNRSFSPDIFIPRGSVGLGAPDFDLVSDKYPFFPGSYLRHINTNPRELQIPIFIRNESLGGLSLAVEDLHEWFETGDETQRTPGYFRVCRPDGSIRQIACYFQGGFLGNTDEGGPDWTQYVIELFAPDPYPTDLDMIEENPTISTLAAIFGTMNPGRLQAYPIWTIHGPFTTVNLANSTTGKNLGFTITMTSVQTLTIDTRPDELRQGLAVHDNLGNNLIGQIGVGIPVSEFWTLAPGANNMIVSFGLGATGDTDILLQYLPRYRSLLR